MAGDAMLKTWHKGLDKHRGRIVVTEARSIATTKDWFS